MYEVKADDHRIEVPKKHSLGFDTRMANPAKVSTAGYHQLSPEEQALINRVKAVAEEVAHLVTDVRDFTENHPLEQDGVTRLSPARWAALADTDFQVGFMKLLRSIARPSTY